MKETIPSFAVPRSDPVVAFQKFGLRSLGILGGSSIEADYREISEPARFRGALEELGGLYAAFGQFLMWRADLLRTDYLGRLRSLKLDVPPIPASDVRRILLSELGPMGGVLGKH